MDQAIIPAKVHAANAIIAIQTPGTSFDEDAGFATLVVAAVTTSADVLVGCASGGVTTATCSAAGTVGVTTVGAG